MTTTTARAWLLLLLAAAAAVAIAIFSSDGRDAGDADVDRRDARDATSAEPNLSTTDAAGHAADEASDPFREAPAPIAAPPTDASATLRGRVTQAGAPVPGASVRLLEHVERDADAGAIVPGDAYAVRRANAYLRSRSTMSGKDGAFDFPAVDPGRYDVVAVKGPTVRATLVDVDVVVGATGSVSLDLPAEGGIRGRLVVPPTINANEMRLSIEPAALANEVAFDDPTARPRGVTYSDPSGEFAVNGLRAGPATIFVELGCGRPTIHALTTLGPSQGIDSLPRFQLATVTIPENDVLTVDFDVTQIAPGRLEVEIDAEPARLRDLDLVLRVERTAGPAAPTEIVRLERRGVPVVRSLAAGDWRAMLETTDGTWTDASPTLFTVAPGVTTRLTIRPRLPGVAPPPGGR